MLTKRYGIIVIAVLSVFIIGFSPYPSDAEEDNSAAASSEQSKTETTDHSSESKSESSKSSVVKGKASESKAAAESTSQNSVASVAEGEEESGTESMDSAGTILPNLFTGTMKYSIPIEAPVGRKKMSPQLALTYRSNGGNGWVGMGWDLEIDAIELSTKGGIDYTGDKYIVRTAGSTIDLVNFGGNEYRAKIENAFLRIRKLSASDGSYYWEVTDKSGRRSLFGQTSASRQDDPGNPARIFGWCLDRVEDPNGNYMTYTYVKTVQGQPYAGQLYLDRIDYTGNTDGTAPTNYVKFHLENRTDAPEMYYANFKIQTAYRLKTIEVAGGGQVIRAYKLEYDADPNEPGAQYSAYTGRSLLSSVQQFGKDVAMDSTGTITGGSSLPAITFGWSAGGNGWTVNTQFWLQYGINSYYTLFGDLNGDGKTDYFYNNFTLPPSGVAKVGLSTGNGWDVSSPPWVGMPTYSRNCFTGDLNGDGKTDTWCYANTWFVAFSNGSGWATSTWSGPGIQLGGDNFPLAVSHQCFTGDLNGDGKTDMWCETAPNSGLWNVALSIGTGPIVQWNGPAINFSYYTNSSVRDFCFAGDLNGDKKTDMWCETAPNSGVWNIWFSTGSGWTTAQWNGVHSYGETSDGGNGASRFCFKGDLNGDGKTDMWCASTWNGPVFNVALSTGSGWSIAQWNASSSSLGYSTDGTCLTGDLNGDKKTDMWCQTGDASDIWNVMLSTGSGWVVSQWSSPGLGFGVGFGITGDFNGDGLTDLMTTSDALGTTPTNVGLLNGNMPDQLISIRNGRGGATTITYKPSTQYVNTQLSFPVQTVSSVSRCDNFNSGAGTCDGTLSTTNYAYEGGYYHTGEGDFRGFNHVTVRAPAGPNGEQKVTETWFHQGNDAEIGVNNPNVAVGYMKGKTYRTRISGGSAYSEITTLYATTVITNATNTNVVYFSPSTTITTYLLDGSTMGSSDVLTTKVMLGYDNYGNVVREDQYGNLADATDDRTVFRTYSPNTTAWIVNKPASETIYAGTYPGVNAGNIDPEKMASSIKYYYDGVTNCSTAATEQTPTYGNITRIERRIWDDEPDTSETWMAYDHYGNLVCIDDPNGNRSYIDYDGTFTHDGTVTFPVLLMNPLYQIATMAYYGINNVSSDNGLYGQLKSTTDPNGATTITEYDIFGRKAKTTAPDGSWTRWYYNDFGTVHAQHVRTDTSDGLSTWTYFDGLGRAILIKKSGPDGKIIAANTEYNTTGTISRTSLPYFEGLETPRWRNFVYDALGRILRVDNVYDNTSILSCYKQNVTVAIDAEQRRKRTTKNVQGQLTKVEEYVGAYPGDCSTDLLEPYATTTYEYDALRNLETVTDTLGNMTVMYYDMLGRLFFMWDPDRGNMYFTKDAGGNLIEMDATGLDSGVIGQAVTNYYDPLNRLIRMEYSKGAINDLNNYAVAATYAYDESWSTNSVGRLTTMTDESGVTKYQYDAMGRVVNTIKTIDGVEYAISTGYDQGGRVASIRYPGQDSETVTYTYNAGLVSQVTGTTATTTTNYAAYAGYNAFGQPGNITYGNGVTTTYQYFSTNNRLQNITTSGQGQQLINLTYSYYPGGNVSAITDNIDSTKTQAFIYDDLNRLWQAQSSSYGALFYSYDQTGNITNKEGVNYAYDWYPAHGVVSTTTQGGTTKNYTYDSYGNMTSDGVRTMTFNYMNMPKTVTYNNVTTSFVYDGKGTRVKKATPTGENIYIGKLYECKSGICTKYIFDGDSRVAMKTGADVLYYHGDHLGSTRVVSQAGAVVKASELRYRPFGETLTETGPISVSHKYTQQEFDTETGLYNYNARFYNPSLGRFISADTIVPDVSSPQALNRYAYVLNNPLYYKDPSGRSWFHVITEIPGATIGWVLGGPNFGDAIAFQWTIDQKDAHNYKDDAMARHATSSQEQTRSEALENAWNQLTKDVGKLSTVGQANHTFADIISHWGTEWNKDIAEWSKHGDFQKVVGYGLNALNHALLNDIVLGLITAPIAMIESIVANVYAGYNEYFGADDSYYGDSVGSGDWGGGYVPDTGGGYEPPDPGEPEFPCEEGPGC